MDKFNEVKNSSNAKEISSFIRSLIEILGFWSEEEIQNAFNTFLLEIE
ncbi:MAG: hypothetical protein ACFFDX_10235 [Candidatus Odinarchaeota archaeon]